VSITFSNPILKEVHGPQTTDHRRNLTVDGGLASQLFQTPILL
jgi:hypothetical protein